MRHPTGRGSLQRKRTWAARGAQMSKEMIFARSEESSQESVLDAVLLTSWMLIAIDVLAIVNQAST